MDDDRSLGPRVRSTMRSQHIRPTHLAAKLGMSPQSMTNKLAGRRPFTVAEIKGIADELGMTVDDLI